MNQISQKMDHLQSPDRFRVSIVTVSLNNAAGLALTIESVRTQSTRCFEHIIVDGGSADGTVDLLKSVDTYPVNWISEPDLGVFDAMNKGVSLARGTYVYFLNSGDRFIDSDVLRSIERDLSGGQPIICGRVRTTRSGHFVGMADLGSWLPHQGAFVRADILRKFPFDNQLKIFGDLDLWMRLKSAGLYDPVRIERVIAEMEMDGLGNHPRFLGRRWRDKIRLHVKHRDLGRLCRDALVLGSAVAVYRGGGEAAYHRFMHFIQLGKRASAKPWVLFDRGWMAFHSLLMWPLRCFLYRKLGFLAFIHPSAVVRNFNCVSVGARAVINHFVTLNCTDLDIGPYSQLNPGVVVYGKVCIGSHVMIAPNVTIAGGNHRFDRRDIPMMFQGSQERGIVIEDDVWIGANSVITDGVKIGKGAIVGAGSVVTRDVPAGFIVHGQSASRSRRRFTQEDPASSE